jgi:molybdate transport system substrate-binding protein
MKFRLAIAAIAALACLALPAAAAEKVNVFAAASLKTALDQIIADWTSKGEVAATYGASSALAKQIGDGAPADIFISADEAWMDDVAKKSLIKPDSRKDLAGNTLVLVAPADSKATVDIAKPDGIAAVLGDGRLAVADVKSVPAGKYAKAALEKLGAWPAVESKLAMQENVRAALALVARGETPLGIVYGSDAVAEPKVKVIAVFPDDSHAPIRYPASLVATSQSPAAQEFLDFLSSEPAQETLKKNGFTLLK